MWSNWGITLGSSAPPIPDSLRENLAYGHGEAESERWLAHAQTRARALCEAWDLVPEQVLAGGSESLCVKLDRQVQRPPGAR